MWPWEHVMVGYVLYSAYARVRHGRPPSDLAALVVPLAALLPDLIDKPLAWQLSVLPGGRSLAHSLMFAVPVILIVWAVANRLGESDVGEAFGIAYLSHLPADSFYAAIMEGERVDLGYVIWPFASVEPVDSRSFFERLLEVVAEFSELLAGPGAWRFVAVQLLLLSLAVLLWIADGRPGAGAVWRAVGRRARA